VLSVDGCNWIASGWLVQLAIINAPFQDNPCLGGFSSKPDGMPLIEAWRLKIIINILASGSKALVLVSIQKFPLSQSLSPVSKNLTRG
jgi:hypothetical protein